MAAETDRTLQVLDFLMQGEQTPGEEQAAAEQDGLALRRRKNRRRAKMAAQPDATTAEVAPPLPAQPGEEQPLPQLPFQQF